MIKHRQNTFGYIVQIDYVASLSSSCIAFKRRLLTLELASSSLDRLAGEGEEISLSIGTTLNLDMSVLRNGRHAQTFEEKVGADVYGCYHACRRRWGLAVVGIEPVVLVPRSLLYE